MLRIGPRIGPRIGLGGDTPTGIVGVTRDAQNGRYYPADVAEWYLFLASAGLPALLPFSVWPCQESSGSLADTVFGTVPLAQAGAGHLYQQVVPGTARRSVRTTDGTANQRWVNAVNAPDASLTSTLELIEIVLPSGAPAAARDVMTVSTNADLRLNTTGRLRAVFGAQADLANSYLGQQIFIVMQHNLTAGTAMVYTPLEKFTGTFATPVSLTMFALGGHTTQAATIHYLYAAQFVGAAAELTSTQIKTLVTTLGWPTPPWS